MPELPVDDILSRLRELQTALGTALRAHMRDQEREVWSRTVRDDAGDTVFGLDAAVEETLLARCRAWGEETPFLLLAEGLPPEGVPCGTGPPTFRMLADPVDGTRGLMADKRSAWCLAAIAPDRGPATRLADVELAVMTELPTLRQATVDCLWAVRGRGARGERHNLYTGTTEALPLVPSNATDLQHGFATVDDFFQGGKVPMARLAERIFTAGRGPWNPAKAEVWSDQYISTGGQLAELALGRDRFVLDVRPLVHRALGHEPSLCAKPYDLCTALIAREAGCVLTDPMGGPLYAPLDVGTNVAWAGYANPALAERLGPIVAAALAEVLGDPD